MYMEGLPETFMTQQEKCPFDFAYANLSAALRPYIANGRVEPGTIFNIYSLANVLQVSRTTVLKAMNILLTENWVSLNDRTRYIAAKPTMQQIRDIIIFRESVEPQIIKLATRNATAQDMAELARALERFREIDLSAACSDDDIRGIVIIEVGFHDKLCEMCRNEYLIKAYRVNRDRISQQIWLTYKSHYEQRRSEAKCDSDYPYQLHDQLFGAIKSRNEQMAMGSVFTHQRNLDFAIYAPYTMT